MVLARSFCVFRPSTSSSIEFSSSILANSVEAVMSSSFIFARNSFDPPPAITGRKLMQWKRRYLYEVVHDFPSIFLDIRRMKERPKASYRLTAIGETPPKWKTGEWCLLMKLDVAPQCGHQRLKISSTVSPLFGLWTGAMRITRVAVEILIWTRNFCNIVYDDWEKFPFNSGVGTF